ncbi:hypothetical protein NFI96_014153 [Prochilodus magdalenae]|nr:hypothetical protein NFI96_014153 [Prochilodus magdalenae]
MHCVGLRMLNGDTTQKPETRDNVTWVIKPSAAGRFHYNSYNSSGNIFHKVRNVLMGIPHHSSKSSLLKWCAWIAVYCSFISFANSRSSEDTKQMMSSFMLSISAVVMSYLQNPQPMSPPW